MKYSKVRTEDEANKVALLRFSIIAPVVNNSHAFPSKMAFFRHASLQEYELPSGKKTMFSYNSIRNWYNNYKRYGFDVLKPKIRKDLGASRRITPQISTKIFELKEQMPHITGKAIYNKLIEDDTINAKDFSIATIYRYLNNNNLKFIPTIERKQFEMEHSNDCWQADTSHGPVLKIDGKKVHTYLVQIIDDASRLVVGCEFFLNDNAINFQAVLKQAIQTYGIPKRLFVDNGTPYKNIQFETICASIGTVLIHAKPYSPESKGKVERCFRTVKDNFINCTNWNTFTSLEDLNEKYYNYVNTEYNNNFHSSIEDTPRNRFMKDYSFIKFINDEQQLEEYFLHTFERRVSTDSTIQLFSKCYEVPSKYMKQTITIKTNPNNLDVAYIYDNGKKTETIYPVKKIENSKVKRKSISYARIGGDNND